MGDNSEDQEMLDAEDLDETNDAKPDEEQEEEEEEEEEKEEEKEKEEEEKEESSSEDEDDSKTKKKPVVKEGREAIHRLHDALNKAEASGAFACGGDLLHFVSPGLWINDYGVMSFPVTEALVRDIVNKCSSSDADATFQMSADRMKLNNLTFHRQVKDLFEKEIAPMLGLDAKEIRTTAYKLVIQRHGYYKFDPKEEQEQQEEIALGYLAIMLPSDFEGGEMVAVSHESVVKHYKTSQSWYQASYVAFLAGSHYEVTPVTKGCRTVLWYKLVHIEGKSAPAPSLQSLEVVSQATECLKEWQQSSYNEMAVILLEDKLFRKQKDISPRLLQGKDRVKYSILRSALENTGDDFELCLGVATFTFRSKDEDDRDVIDFNRGYWKVTGLVDAKGGQPSALARKVQIEGEDVLPTDQFDERFPDAEDWFGDEDHPVGEYKYYAGALLLWPKRSIMKFLCRDSIDTAVDSLSMMMDQCPIEPQDSAEWEECRNMARVMLNSHNITYKMLKSLVPLLRRLGDVKLIEECFTVMKPLKGPIQDAIKFFDQVTQASEEFGISIAAPLVSKAFQYSAQSSSFFQMLIDRFYTQEFVLALDERSKQTIEDGIRTALVPVAGRVCSSAPFAERFVQTVKLAEKIAPPLAPEMIDLLRGTEGNLPNVMEMVNAIQEVATEWANNSPEFQAVVLDCKEAIERKLLKHLSHFDSTDLNAGEVSQLLCDCENCQNFVEFLFDSEDEGYEFDTREQFDHVAAAIPPELLPCVEFKCEANSYQMTKTPLLKHRDMANYMFSWLEQVKTVIDHSLVDSNTLMYRCCEFIAQQVPKEVIDNELKEMLPKETHHLCLVHLHKKGFQLRTV